MNDINEAVLKLDRKSYDRNEIELRMSAGGFSSLSKFELFIWDLEMFLQFQERLGDKILLKGGAATQFYIPKSAQRTSIDIDMLCFADPEEVHQVLKDVEKAFEGKGDYCKFRKFNPKNPKVGLTMLETYFETVPSICSDKELFSTAGKQEVKIEFIFTNEDYQKEVVSSPSLFALDTDKSFNILSFENLFADKLTTLGPNTIGITEDRDDELFKQVYDVITLFLNNRDRVIENPALIREHYKKVAKFECEIRSIDYNLEVLLEDMKTVIERIKGLENDEKSMQKALDFQALYLRKDVNRNKSEWVIVGWQLDIMQKYIFEDNKAILQFDEIVNLIKIVKFEDISGPERGKRIRKVREGLEEKYTGEDGLHEDLFKKRLDRVLWELSCRYGSGEVMKLVNELANVSKEQTRVD